LPRLFTGLELPDFPEARIEFGRDAFAADPRIAAMQWER
jgi:hypothetical protein